MAYKYSVGPQTIADLTGSADSEGDTVIDFEEDYIGFITSGSSIMVVSGSRVGIGTTAPDYALDVAGNIGMDEYLYHNGDTNTYIRFQNDDINMQVGGTSMIKMDKGNNVVKINNANQDIDFKIKDNNSNVLFHADAGEARIGVGTDSPIAELDVNGKIAITAEVATPSQPADGKGYLYTKSDGKIYWRSHDVSETDLTATGGGGGGGSGDALGATAQKTSNYTASNWDFVLVNLVGASGDVTITLPAASSDAQVVVKIAGVANGKTVTVDGNSSETIDGAATKIMDSDYESMHLISDGSNWWRIS